jgi:hypothetical protein
MGSVSRQTELSPSSFSAMSEISAKPSFVYVLRSETGHRFYIGIAGNIAA